MQFSPCNITRRSTGSEVGMTIAVWNIPVFCWGNFCKEIQSNKNILNSLISPWIVDVIWSTSINFDENVSQVLLKFLVCNTINFQGSQPKNIPNLWVIWVDTSCYLFKRIFYVLSGRARGHSLLMKITNTSIHFQNHRGDYTIMWRQVSLSVHIFCKNRHFLP
jgi:hypothetical protein